MNWLRVCVICGTSIRWDDDVCSDRCQAELDRRSDQLDANDDEEEEQA